MAENLVALAQKVDTLSPNDRDQLAKRIAALVGTMPPEIKEQLAAALKALQENPNEAEVFERKLAEFNDENNLAKGAAKLEAIIGPDYSNPAPPSDPGKVLTSEKTPVLNSFIGELGQPYEPLMAEITQRMGAINPGKIEKNLKASGVYAAEYATALDAAGLSKNMRMARIIEYCQTMDEKPCGQALTAELTNIRLAAINPAEHTLQAFQQYFQIPDEKLQVAVLAPENVANDTKFSRAELAKKLDHLKVDPKSLAADCRAIVNTSDRLEYWGAELLKQTYHVKSDQGLDNFATKMQELRERLHIYATPAISPAQATPTKSIFAVEDVPNHDGGAGNIPPKNGDRNTGAGLGKINP